MLHSLARLEMRGLHDAFSEGWGRETAVGVLRRLIAAKLAKIGIKLRPRELREVALRVYDRGGETIRLRPFAFWNKREVTITFTDDDAAELARLSSGLDEKNYEEVLRTTVQNLADECVTHLQRHWRRQRRRENRITAGFRRRLRHRWRLPLDKLKMLRAACLELGAIINRERRAHVVAEEQFLTEALTRLHARACQVAEEIIVLLEHGLGDGAIARWRTLHEIAVVAVLLRERGEEVAERYVLHQAMETAKGAREYQKHCEALGLEPIADEIMASLQAEHDRLVARYGPSFKESYGWAAATLSNQKPTFALIEAAVGIDHMRPYYRMASHNVHANPKGAFFRLGLVTEGDFLLAGPSNDGLADPGSGTALSLLQVTSALSMLEPTLDHLMFMEALGRIEREVGRAFSEEEDRVANAPPPKKKARG